MTVRAIALGLCWRYVSLEIDFRFGLQDSNHFRVIEVKSTKDSPGAGLELDGLYVRIEKNPNERRVRLEKF